MQTELRVPERGREFDRLFQRSRAHAYNLAFRLTGNFADAEDVTQDAYLRAWANFDRYDFNCSFESWLFRIISNRAIDLHRRKCRVKMVSLDVSVPGKDGTAFAQEFVSPESDPEEIVLRRIPDERLQIALAELPPMYLTPLLLCQTKNLSYEEVAIKMQCSIGAVRSRVHRGRVKLRASLR